MDIVRRWWLALGTPGTAAERAMNEQRLQELKRRMEVKIHEAVNSFELETERRVQFVRLHHIIFKPKPGIVDIVETRLFP